MMKTQISGLWGSLMRKEWVMNLGFHGCGQKMKAHSVWGLQSLGMYENRYACSLSLSVSLTLYFGLSLYLSLSIYLSQSLSLSTPQDKIQ